MDAISSVNYHKPHMIHRFTEEKSSAIESRKFEVDGKAGRVRGGSLPTNMPVRFQCLPAEIRVIILEHCLQFEGVINPFPKIYGNHEAKDRKSRDLIGLSFKKYQVPYTSIGQNFGPSLLPPGKLISSLLSSPFLHLITEI